MTIIRYDDLEIKDISDEKLDAKSTLSGSDEADMLDVCRGGCGRLARASETDREHRLYAFCSADHDWPCLSRLGHPVRRCAWTAREAFPQCPGLLMLISSDYFVRSSPW